MTPWEFATSRPVLTAYVAAILACSALQLVIGADTTATALVSAAALLSVLPALLLGIRDMPALITAAVGGRYATSALFWKAFELEPVDRGLYAPRLSFEVILIGVSAIALAAILIRAITPTRPLFHERYNAVGQDTLLYSGTIFLVANLVASRTHVDVANGFLAIANTGTTLLPLAMLMRNHAAGRPILSPFVLCVLFVLTVMSLGGNSREALFLPGFAAVCFILCFRVPLSRNAVIGAAAIVLFMGAVVSPAILVVRSARAFATGDQIIGYTLDAIGSGKAFQYARLASQFRAAENGAYAMHYTKGSDIVQRAVNVEQMDIVVDRAHRFGLIGTGRFWQGVVEMLPSVIIHDKTVAQTPSYVFWVYGLIPWGMEFNATPTLFGDGYSIGGETFVFWYSLTVFGLYFLVFRLFCPRFDRSLLAAFIVGTFLQNLTETNTVGLIGTLIRMLPFQIALFWLASSLQKPYFSLFAPQTLDAPPDERSVEA